MFKLPKKRVIETVTNHNMIALLKVPLGIFTTNKLQVGHFNHKLKPLRSQSCNLGLFFNCTDYSSIV